MRKFLLFACIIFFAAACGKQPPAQTPTAALPSGNPADEPAVSLPAAAPTSTAQKTAKPKAQEPQWKILQNKTLGYEISLPANWQFEELDNYKMKLNGPKNLAWLKKIQKEKLESVAFANDINIDYWESYEAEAKEQRENFESDYKVNNIPDLIKSRGDLFKPGEQINFAGQKAHTYTAGGLGKYYTVLMERGGRIYQIRFGNKGFKTDLDATEKRILESFKFIK